MTEISEAALKRARDLFCGSKSIWREGRLVASLETAALARVLQEHSDVAKACAQLLRDAKLDGGPAYKSLQSLILPDEPCEHEVRHHWPEPVTVTLFAGITRLGCTKCGKWLKIVEAGDE